ncbi:MAG: hypothetical protein EBZ67_10195, partial [Chitinophagia bacterium]|nr:hypothetical protein [Chitinophagia bacterium]
QEELELATDARVMLVKGSVIEKVMALLDDLSERQLAALQSYADLIPDALTTPAKVSRGENYRGQPYVVLDNPRHFHPGDIFAIRTMFLWGHHLSVTLHLRGAHRERFLPRLTTVLPQCSKAGMHVCVSSSEWEHHFGGDNYIPARELPQPAWESLLRDRSFTKLAYALPLEVFNDGPEPLMAAYAGMLGLLR